MSDLRELLARVQAATGLDREIDVDVLTSIGGWRHIDGSLFYGPGEAVAHLCDGWFDPEVQELPFVTASLDAVTELIEQVLPGWFWTCGLCNLTGHASIGPDYNSPERERLLASFPVEQFDGAFDADLAPGDGRHRVCYALLDCMLQALIKIEETRHAA